MSFVKSLSKAIGYVANPVGDFLNGISGINSQMDKSYSQQMSAMNAQNAYNTYMWNLANQYNTPSAQLARMADAGIEINPTSYALGTGNLSNTASVVSSENGFAGSGSPAGNPVSMAMGVAQGVQGIRESKARTALDQANTKNFTSNTANIEERTRQMKNDNDFFEAHGYYPPHGDTPALSSYDTGPVKKGLDEAWSIFKEAHQRARARYVKDHPDYTGW